MVVWLVFDDLGVLEEIYRDEEKAIAHIHNFGNSKYCIESWVVK